MNADIMGAFSLIVRACERHAHCSSCGYSFPHFTPEVVKARTHRSLQITSKASECASVTHKQARWWMSEFTFTVGSVVGSGDLLLAKDFLFSLICWDRLCTCVCVSVCARELQNVQVIRPPIIKNTYSGIWCAEPH